MTQVIPLKSDLPGPVPTAKERLWAIRWPRLWVALMLVTVIGALLAWALQVQRNQALQSGQRLTASFARVIEEQTARTFQTVDQRLQLAARAISDLKANGQLNETAARAVLQEQMQSVPFVRAMGVQDAQGNLLVDTSGGTLAADLQDRASFQTQQSDPNAGFLLTLPNPPRSKEAWLLTASRALRPADGRFDGVIVATVEPLYFDNLWRNLDLGHDGSVALTTREGILVVRTPNANEVRGKSFKDRPVFKELLPVSPRGDLVEASGIDNVVRLFSYRALQSQPGFVVIVGQSYGDVLAPWHQLATVAALIWLLGSITVIALSVSLDRAWRQRKQARELMELTAQRLAMATEAAAIGIWDWDVAQNNWSATPTYFALLGDSPDSRFTDIERWLVRIHPDDRARVQATLASALAGEAQEFQYEARFQHADGRYRWLEVSGRALAHDSQGRATRLLGARTDITERKETQQTKLQVLERVTNAVMSMDKDWRCTYVNPKAAETLTNEASWFIGKHFWKEYPQLVGLEFHQACLQAMAEQKPIEMETYFAPEDRWFENHLYPSPEGLTIYFQDISARKHAEQALQASEESLSITLQSIGDAVIATDPLGRITRMNAMAERLTAWPLADAVGQPLTTVFRIINAKTRAPAVDPVQTVMSTGQVVGLANHTALLARDGREYQIFDSAAPIRDANNAILGVVLVFSDVTEAYRVSEALAVTQGLLERTSELARVGGWEMDLRANIIQFSKETVRLNGGEYGNALSIDDGLNSYPEEIRALLAKAMKNTVETGEGFTLEIPRQVQGQSLWIRTQGTAVIEDGQVVKIQGATQDITPQKLAELALQESEARFRNLVEWMPEAMAVHRNGILLYANTAAARLFGAPSVEYLVGTSAIDRIHPADREVSLLRLENVREMGDSAPLIDSRFLQLDGTVIEVQVQSTQILFDGSPAIQTMMRDVSASRRLERLAVIAQKNLNQAAHHTQSILDNLMDGVITIDNRGLVESINQAACALFGYNPREVIGCNISMLTPEPHRSQHDGYLHRYLSTNQPHILGKVAEVEGLRKDGSLFPMSLQVSEVVLGDATTFIGIVRDITQQRRDIEEIRRLAFYDSLTGLPNRRLLMDRLRQALHTSNRSGHHGALMFLDLDHFKQLNDTHGHDLGDLLLQQVAARIQGCARVGDSLARLGGDEFVVLLENLSTNATEAASQAETVANKILHSFQGAFQLNTHAHDNTTSIGIVVFKGEHDAMDELLKKADLAMYQAKAAGRNTARFFDPAMQAAVAARDALEKDLREALVTQAFAVHYQIQVDEAGTSTGAEALVRWNHPSQGMVSPAYFIPLAEETGLIQPLGQWVLKTA